MRGKSGEADCREDNSEVAAEVSGESADRTNQPRRRGRGRGQQRQGQADQPKLPPVQKAEPVDEDSDDTADNPADWDVPSWTELIASLYRPER